MKKVFFCFFFFLITFAKAQMIRPYEGIFYNKEWNVSLTINLYDTVLVVPNYKFLGKMNGYYQGDIHECWFITNYKINEKNAIVHFSNEMGSEDQEIMLTPQDSTHLIYEVVGNDAIRKVVHNKWVKLPLKMTFERKKDLPRVKHIVQRFRQY